MNGKQAKRLRRALEKAPDFVRHPRESARALERLYQQDLTKAIRKNGDPSFKGWEPPDYKEQYDEEHPKGPDGKPLRIVPLEGTIHVKAGLKVK